MEVKNIFKALFGVDDASPEVIEERRKICRTCSYNLNGWCGYCGCRLSLKTRVRTSTCPVHLW